MPSPNTLSATYEPWYDLEIANFYEIKVLSRPYCFSKPLLLVVKVSKQKPKINSFTSDTLVPMNLTIGLCLTYLIRYSEMTTLKLSISYAA